MLTAALFPGQGSQAVGMGAELAIAVPSVAARFAEASEILGYDLGKLCAEGPAERLSDTLYAQPALFVAGFATWEALAARGASAAAMAGHSLGEYTAAAAAGAISFADGVRAVRARAEAMAECAKAAPGAMVALVGARVEDVSRWVGEAGARGPCVLANRNAPDQVIVSGATAAVDAVEAAANAAGVRAIRLNVSGAFHSPLMRPAADRMRAVLARLPFADPKVPVIGNIAAAVLATAAAVREELETQLISPVLWDSVVRALAARGVARAVECGPGRVLAGLVRRTERGIAVATTGSLADFEAAVAALAGAGASA